MSIADGRRRGPWVLRSTTHQNRQPTHTADPLTPPTHSHRRPSNGETDHPPQLLPRLTVATIPKNLRDVTKIPARFFAPIAMSIWGEQLLSSPAPPREQPPRLRANLEPGT